ncbi:uncharacterized protein N7446_005764 [Penicillium canescens]|uniref:Dimeric alpha-beta barrel n=1 Tax=Penicillium canescens TaxID=5083 RepID=A0AAD6NC21_PENCN|nr:uncharacterized protein N7446_005764 [Penicillium canescens]KAJ6051133.1 hypothetical protein N7460_001667 [Penicillium canescens]KAJ6061644.1 hypothetical protein N7446_005764 [Penicillium canescens]KAJ6064891.1 hypothetical protein N7444_000544 [Penicillium canescens]
MPVTEIALLRLNTEDLSTSTKTGLLGAQQAQAEYSNHQVYFLRQIEDPACVYLLGGWESFEKHMNQWIPSETNQTLLQQLAGSLEVKWMFHLDVDPSTSRIPLEAPVLAISRYFVESEKKAEFDTVFKTGVPHLGTYTAPFIYCGGWRVDKEGDDEEYVLFSGWNEVKDHFAFAESEGFKEFGKIKGLIKGAEIKHVRVEKWA